MSDAPKQFACPPSPPTGRGFREPLGELQFAVSKLTHFYRRAGGGTGRGGLAPCAVVSSIATSFQFLEDLCGDPHALESPADGQCAWSSRDRRFFRVTSE